MSSEKRARSPVRGQARSAAPDGPALVRDGVGRAPLGADEHARGHERISEIQRARIVAAMVAVASEHGVGYATIARVVARSGISRRTFYEQFVDREDCFAAAFDQSVERIAAVVVPVYRQPSKWHERIRGGLTALLEFLDLEHDIARFVIVETLGAGHNTLERRRRCIAQIITVIDREGREAITGEGPPPLMAEGIIGGMLSLIHSRMAAGKHTSLLELLGPLMAMIVLPYLGPAAARRELTRSIPVSHNGTRRADLNSLRNLDMRLTYRTIRVLLAIGEQYGRGSYPSNRQVADAAGIRDQGQVSKLLARLEHLGLVENTGEPRLKGEPNKWRLTKRGHEVCEVVSV